MTKKSKITAACAVLLLMACGLIWWFLPVHFLRGVEPEEVAAVIVSNGNNGDIFELTGQDDISYIVNSVKQISLRKYGRVSGAGYYYSLTFIDETGEEIDSFGIQNHNFMRRGDDFYRRDGEPGVVAEYLDHLESIRFPDYKMDPDLRYS